MTEQEQKVEQILWDETWAFLKSFDKNGAWAPLHLIRHIIHFGNWDGMTIHRGIIDFESGRRWLYCSDEPSGREEYEGAEIEGQYFEKHKEELLESL